ncbi:cytochrome c oxidase subunit 5A, mitochondrial-like [Cimex lectularius]|uniref:Cytochrome c oxidase subunit 5A, mitochondrial n=1 Tax=Cimex lectularius TaxID=79782 RepID=A0A8I6RMP1_CIMLE|nr:cytochrome c oxidase subunit 5A, mitochondrial-like [Cimex lectularius]
MSMFFSFASRAVRRFYQPPMTRTMANRFEVMDDLPDDEMETNFTAIFDKGDIDGWELRKALCDMHGFDMIPSPPLIKSALKACRRCNDYALAVRFLEAIRYKCADRVNIWPYLIQEIQPTLDELGIDPPEKLGYDKPELALKSVYEEN